MSEIMPEDLSLSPSPVNRNEPPIARSDIARVICLCAIAPPVLGLIILAGFYVTEWNILVLVGILWLLGGGVLTLGLGISAIAGWIGSFTRGGETAKARRWFERTLFLNVLTLPIAVVCVRVGGHLATYPPFAVEIMNNSPTPIEITLHFDGGDTTYGPIEGRSMRRFRPARHAHAGPVNMTIHAAGGSATTQASEHLDSDEMGTPFRIEVQETDVPAEPKGNTP